MSGINSVKNYKYSILVKNKGIKKTKERREKSVLEAPFIHSTYDIERELNETSMFKLDPLSNSSLTTNENIYNYLTILNKELNFSEIYLSQRFIIT